MKIRGIKAVVLSNWLWVREGHNRTAVTGTLGKAWYSKDCEVSTSITWTMRPASQKVLSKEVPASDRSTDINYQYQSRKYQEAIHTQRRIMEGKWHRTGKGFRNHTGCLVDKKVWRWGGVRTSKNARNGKRERKQDILNGKEVKDYLLYYLHPLVRTRGRHPLSSCLHLTRTACIFWLPTVLLFYTPHTPTSRQFFWWSLPSCGKPALSDPHNQIVYGRNDVYPEQRAKLFLPCTGSPYVVCVSCTSYPCSMFVGFLGRSPFWNCCKVRREEWLAWTRR